MVKKRPTIALFGGSFDPPHRGHQAIVEKLSSLEDIDKVIIMPTYLNPFKKESFASAQQRLDWCSILWQHNNVIVSDYEVKQARSVYTIETLEMLERDYAVKYLVIGSDNLEKIEQWKAFDTINKRITWLIFPREEALTMCSKLRDYRVLPLKIPVSSTQIRSGLSLEQVDPRIRTEVQHIIQKENHDD